MRETEPNNRRFLGVLHAADAHARSPESRARPMAIVRSLFVLVLVAVGLVAAVAATSAAPTATRPLVTPATRPLMTAIVDPYTFGQENLDLAFGRVRAAGAGVVRLNMPWNVIAPAARPPSFDPTDPGDPAYSAVYWGKLDEQVKEAARNDLEPLIAIDSAPSWAQNRAQRPDLPDQWDVSATEFAKFATAAARRYSGSFAGLPRVRYWQVWNEPNLSSFFNPQLSTQLTKKPTLPFKPAEVISPAKYRELVNAFAAAVKGVRRDNYVVAGGLAPFSSPSPIAVGPLLFTRKVLCMSAGSRPKPTCTERARFDIWSTHPYTAGGPTVEARGAEDVSIGDLPEMNRLLRAADEAGHILSSRRVAFWVTEFAWDTKPPDPYGVPLGLNARWVAEGLYRMWMSGVSLVTWYPLRDAPEAFQGGLYFRAKTMAQDRAKPALAAFRFPFVAFRSNERIRIWGRTPWGRQAQVVVEQSGSAGWKRLALLRTNKVGIFQATVRRAKRGGLYVRARTADGSARALPFSLRIPPDLIVNPFGGPTDDRPKPPRARQLVTTSAS